jgi:hypothetical protein
VGFFFLALVFVTSYEFALQFAEQPLLIALSGYVRARRGDEDVYLTFQHVVSSGSVVAFAEDDFAGVEPPLYNGAFVQLEKCARDAFEYRQRQQLTNIDGDAALQALEVLSKDLLVRERTCGT